MLLEIQLRNEAVKAADRAAGLDYYYDNAVNDKRRIERKEAVAEIPCAVCGKLFKPNGANTVCSDECRAERRKMYYYTADLNRGRNRRPRSSEKKQQ